MLNAYFGRIIPLMAVGRRGAPARRRRGDGDLQQGRATCPITRLAAQAAQDPPADRGRGRAGAPDWPRFRAGVNSGEVLAGVVGGARGHRKHGVVGDTVNLASRLRAEAPVGEVVLGQRRSGAFRPGHVVERLPELRVKGKAEPIEAYVLRS